MNKKNFIALLFAFLSLATAMPLYAATGNPYASDGVTDYQYYQGFYNYKRLLKMQECLKESGAFDKNGLRVSNYDAIQRSCDIKSYSIMPLETVVPQPDAKEPWNTAAKNYHDRFMQKCLSTYNDPSVNACCEMQATADTNSMQKRGVFDTPTTAEIPIVVDEAKCKPKEYKYSCSGAYGDTSKKEACADYLNRCIEAGKFAYQNEKGKINGCELDYALNRPIKLGTLEKYVNICLKSRAGEGEDVESQKGGCLADYYGAVREYRDRCVASLSKVDYNPFNNWVIRIRGMFGPAAYKAKALECVKRYDQALDKQMTQ